VSIGKKADVKRRRDIGSKVPEEGEKDARKVFEKRKNSARKPCF